jgi:hypothetical protein
MGVAIVQTSDRVQHGWTSQPWHTGESNGSRVLHPTNENRPRREVRRGRSVDFAPTKVRQTMVG